MIQIARFAVHLCHRIWNETESATTNGISTNQLLAKIASGLKKPGFVSILKSADGCNLEYSMPLSIIPGIGSCTMKVLRKCIESQQEIHDRGDNAIVWTCV
jgi:nucleotidyltransferase/DNA polymerase involved in DNA repair